MNNLSVKGKETFNENKDAIRMTLMNFSNGSCIRNERDSAEGLYFQYTVEGCINIMKFSLQNKTERRYDNEPRYQ